MLSLRYVKLLMRYTILIIPIYMLIMLLISQVFIANPELVFTNQASAGGIINPFEGGGDVGDNVTDYSERFKQFEADVFILSGHQEHDLFLSARPGAKAQLYRNFSIYIFSNQPCFYEIKMDDQIYERGYLEFKTVVKASSPYEHVSIYVRLINNSNVSLPTFSFSELPLLDSPWEISGEEGEAAIVEEWIRFTRGEFTSWVIMRILIDVGFAFLGVVFGTSYATLHADLRGIDQIL